MSIRHLVFVVCVSLGASSGALAKNHHDEEPTVVTSKDCNAALKKFRRIFDRYYFAMSADGKVCSYSYCQSGGCQRDDVSSLTLHFCAKESGTTCQRYGPEDPVPGLMEN